MEEILELVKNESLLGRRRKSKKVPAKEENFKDIDEFDADEEANYMQVVLE
jgi:hypothetical protein